MKIIARSFALLLLTLLLFPLALAADPLFPESVTDQQVAFLAAMARKNLSKARLRSGAFVPAETPAEKSQPLLSPTESKRVVQHGIYEAMLHVCEQESSPEFSEFMSRERRLKARTDKQMAYMGLLHGVTAGYYIGEFEKRGGCTDAVQGYISKRQASHSN